jgi:hypothetical protein
MLIAVALVQGRVPAPAQKLVALPSNKLLIQVFIFSSKCCFNDCFCFFAFPVAASDCFEPETSVVICNTAVILTK